MMETVAQPIFVAPQGTTTYSVFGIPVDILVTGDETNGACSAYRIHCEPGDGPILHIHHHDDEAFYVLDGEFEIICGERVEVVTAGAFVFLPRLVPHTFRNVGTMKGRLLGIGTPPGHEKFFEGMGKLTMPPKMDEAMTVCRQNGIELIMTAA